jgi:hypothetical protein
MITLDNTIHISEAIAIVGGLWKINRSFVRFLDIMKDFPPHRHVNGKIMYPKGFNPGMVEGNGSSATSPY